MAQTYLLLITDASQIVQVCTSNEKYKRGKDMDEVCVLKNAFMVVGQDGRIADIGPMDEFESRHADSVFETTINATHKAVLPGFVDGHTHAVWSGDRVHEFAMKLAGATYMDIHKAGGGIGFTVKHVRESSEDELLSLFMGRLDRVLRHGTTVMEGKSGYGLETESEMKMMKVLHRATTSNHPVEVISTYCGAHSVPKGMSSTDYTKQVIDEQLPRLKALMAEHAVSPTLVDVFCEKGVFNVDETRDILNAGTALGLEVNFHGDELNPVGGAELAGELKALAMSHCEHVTEGGIQAMALRPTFAVLLPTTAYVLRIEPPPAQALIKGGVPVALGSDFNPNAHCPSMPHVMNLACVNMKMTMNQALAAATINAAGSLGVADDHGSLEVGKWGNAVILNTDSWEHIIYEMVDSPIESVIVRGLAVVHKK